MDSATRLQYQETIDKAQEYYHKIGSLESTNQWELCEDSEGVTIHVRQDPVSGLRMTRAETIIEAKPHAVKDVLNLEEETLKWDRSLSTYEILDHIEEFKISRSLSTKIVMVTQREAILLFSTVEKEGKSFLVVGKSFEHEDFPPDQNFVTAVVHLFAWHLIPIEDEPGRTKVVYILHVDPKGWIPTSLFNMGVQEEAKKVKLLKKFLESKETETALKRKKFELEN